MDWAQLIAELKATGLNQAEIAAAVNCRQPTISELANGKMKVGPVWPLGEALRSLHKKRMRRHARRQTAAQA